MQVIDKLNAAVSDKPPRTDIVISQKEYETLTSMPFSQVGADLTSMKNSSVRIDGASFTGTAFGSKVSVRVHVADEQ